MKVLVIRFSAMGDVALLTPVLTSLVTAYPNVTVTVLTRKRFSAFFSTIERVSVMGVDLDVDFKGLIGLWRLSKLIQKEKFNLIVDLHDNLRSIILRSLLRLTGVPVSILDKGRADKRKLSRKSNKKRNKLPHTIERYSKPFEQNGLKINLLKPPFIQVPESENKIDTWLNLQGLVIASNKIALAPFAAHKTKIWPIHNYKKVISLVLERIDTTFFLFGGGSHEIDFFKTLKEEYPKNIIIAAGQLSLLEEFSLMKKVDKLLTVDSSNMHIASILGTPTVSIWGGTHTDAGFGAIGNDKIVEIDINELPCRPCSIYGKETCYLGNFACMNLITPEEVANKLLE